MKKEGGKVGEIITGIILSVSFIVIFLISAFEIGAYGNWEFYEKEYEKYKVADELYMEMEDIMGVTKYMMSYLRGNEKELSIETMVEGRKQDFFNEQDRLHMKDVQDLFIGGLWLRRISIVAVIVSFVVLWRRKKNWKMFLPGVYQKTLAAFGIVTAVLGILIAQNFNRCFIAFHHIFFDNDLWIFDPSTDYMIRMLPEGFFYDIVIRIGSIFVIMLAVSLVISVFIQRKIEK